MIYKPKENYDFKYLAGMRADRYNGKSMPGCFGYKIRYKLRCPIRCDAKELCKRVSIQFEDD